MARQCYIGAKEEILKNMNLPDQQFIYALDFWNGAHLGVGVNLLNNIQDTKGRLITEFAFY